jgi:hypothetical protein
MCECVSAVRRDFLCDSIPLLQEANKLFSPPINQFDVAISEFGPSNLYRALELFPFAFNLVPVHWLSPELSATGSVPPAWEMGRRSDAKTLPPVRERRNLAHKPDIEDSNFRRPDLQRDKNNKKRRK